MASGAASSRLRPFLPPTLVGQPADGRLDHSFWRFRHYPLVAPTRRHPDRRRFYPFYQLHVFIGPDDVALSLDFDAVDDFICCFCFKGNMAAPARRIAPYRVAGGTFLAAALLYLCFPAARYNFDGVAAAIAVELGDFRHLLHGNHLAYGFLGYLFFDVIGLFGIPLPSILCLQIFSSLLGAAAVGAFSLI